MAAPSVPHLDWTRDQFFRGETVRLTFALGTLDPMTVTAFQVAMELETSATLRVVVSLLPGGVPAGENGVQLIDPTAATPPEAPGTTVYEAVIETSLAPALPAGWYRTEARIEFPYGSRTVSAGRLHLRETALA